MDAGETADLNLAIADCTRYFDKSVGYQFVSKAEATQAKEPTIFTAFRSRESTIHGRGLDRNAAVILTTKTKLPWKARYFKSQWEAASKKAGITDLHFHDLRGTASPCLPRLDAQHRRSPRSCGHSLKTVTTILDKYLARTRALAGEAVTLFENAKSTKFANRLQTRTPQKEPLSD